MTFYRNPSAAKHLGHIIQTHFDESNLSAEEFAIQLRLRSASKLASLFGGKHYFQLETAKPIADALEIDIREIIRLILLQYHPPEEVFALFRGLSEFAIQLKKVKKTKKEAEKKTKRKQGSRKRD